MSRSAIWKWGALSAIVLMLAASAFALHPFTASAQGPVKSNQRQVLSGHLIPVLHGKKPLAGVVAVDAADMHLSVSLNLRDKSELQALIAAQNDPHSGLYHQYLTPAQFNARYAPTQRTVAVVADYLRSQGLSLDSVASNRQIINVHGTQAAVQRAFATTLGTYANNGHTVYAPLSEPSVPAALGGLILNVAGLDNVAQYHPLGLPATHPATGPGGGYTPTELRTAYDMNSLISSSNGTGQTVAIFELDGYKASDVNSYLSNYSLGTAKYSNVLVDGATNTAGAGAIEVELDMEVVSAIAPGATQKIYIGPNSTTGVNDTYNRIVTDNVAKITSSSWGECEASSGTAELQALNNIFTQGAAQGQAVYSASGDSGAYDCNNSSLGVDSPSDDPNVVGVGGTNLQVGAGGTYSSESVWSCTTCTSRSPKGSGGGGGLSTFFAQPSYQSGPGVSNSFSNGKREMPDVSADADPNSGYSIFCTVTSAGCSAGSGWTSVGGTSAAAPLWAGISADVNQYLTSQSKPTLGSSSAALYRLFNTAQSFTAYHDVTSGNNLFYPATSGYDLASGIGTPDVWNIARDLAGATGGGSPPTVTSFSPTTGAVGTSVGLTGTNFTGATAVKFNGTSATFTVNSSTSISTSVPTGATTGTISVTNASGTGTSSSSFTVTGGGGGGTTTQLLLNPGFESGNASWSESSSGGYEITDPSNPHTGTLSAFLCGYNSCNDQIWQTVALPSSTTKVVLSYWVYFSTNESGSTCYDNFYAKLRTSTGGAITTVQTQCNANAHGWTQYTFDVTTATNSYHGQSIQVYFQGTTDSSLTSSMFVDDVQLNDTH